MTRTLFVLLAAFLFTAGTGCGTGRGLLQQNAACSACGGSGCQACGIAGHLGGDGGCGILGGCGVGSRLAARHSDPGTVSGPPAAQAAYPYYTVRGPRDFFLDEPSPLGP